MLTLQLSEFMLELKDGALKNVGPANKSATAKLFDVTETEVRAFGDKRVKLVFHDEEGNEVQVALFPDDARKVRDEIDSLEAETAIFE